MWDGVGHVVAVDALTEHPAGAQHMDRALWQAKEDSGTRFDAVKVDDH